MSKLHVKYVQDLKLNTAAGIFLQIRGRLENPELLSFVFHWYDFELGEYICMSLFELRDCSEFRFVS